MSMSILPDELLLRVLAPLRYYEQIRLEAVSSRWRRVLRGVWRAVRAIRLSGYLDDEDDAAFVDVRDANRVLVALLQRAGPYLTRLDLASNYVGCGISLEINARSLAALGKYCPELVHLDLTCVQVDNSQLMSLAKACQSLKVIILRRCFNIDEECRDAGLAALFAANADLEEVHLWGNEYFAGACLNQLPAQVRFLQLSNCVDLSRRTVDYDRLQCRDLERFELDKSTCDVTAFLATFTRLEHISVEYYSPAIGERSLLIPAVAHWPRLRTLNLSHSAVVSTKLLEALAIHCPQLETLKLAGCHKDGANGRGFSIAPLSGLQRLKVLDIMWVRCVGDQDLIQVAQQGTLTELHLHYCGQLTASGITSAVRLSPRLTFCDVTGCLYLEHVPAFLETISHVCRKQQPARQTALTVETVYRDADAKALRGLQHDTFNFIRIGERA